MARLFLVRHGQTEMGQARRLCGHSDPPLSPPGRLQAERLGQRLAGERLGAVYASDLQRTTQTAQAIARHHRLAVSPCPEMREINFGQCEGLTYAEVEKQFPKVAQRWASGSPYLSYPQGESLRQVRQRVSRFSPRLQGHSPGDTLVLVAHLGTLRLLLCYLLGIPGRHWWQMNLAPASLSLVETLPPDRSPRGATLSLLNDVSHLDSRA